MVSNLISGNEEARKKLANMKAMKTIMINVNREALGNAIDAYRRQLSKSDEFIEGIKTGTAVPCVEDNVVFMNSLQISWATRFVMSGQNEFGLAKRMLSENPAFRTGLKPQIN
jgi:two-component SAPR family response regulator